MKTIKEIALEKRREYEEGYKQWCKENPGYIMNGLMSKAIGAEIAQYCDTKEELEAHIKISLRRSEAATGPHGHFFVAEAFREILQTFNNQ